MKSLCCLWIRKFMGEFRFFGGLWVSTMGGWVWVKTKNSTPKLTIELKFYLGLITSAATIQESGQRVKGLASEYCKETLAIDHSSHDTSEESHDRPLGGRALLWELWYIFRFLCVEPVYPSAATRTSHQTNRLFDRPRPKTTRGIGRWSSLQGRRISPGCLGELLGQGPKLAGLTERPRETANRSLNQVTGWRNCPWKFCHRWRVDSNVQSWS